MNYVFRSKHSETLADGTSYAPGSVVSLTSEQEQEPFNQRLIDEGVLVKQPQVPTEPGSAPPQTQTPPEVPSADTEGKE